MEGAVSVWVLSAGTVVQVLAETVDASEEAEKIDKVLGVSGSHEEPEEGG